MAPRTDTLDLSPKPSQGEGRTVEEKGEEFGRGPHKGAFLAQGLLIRPGGQNSLPSMGLLAHHPEEARPVLRHVQFWIHGLQEPLEVLTLKLGAKLLPLCHIPKGLLRKEQNSEPLKVMALPIKALLSTAAHSFTKLLLGTECVPGPV